MIDYDMYRVLHQPEGQQVIELQRRDDAGAIPSESLEQLEGPNRDEMLMLLPAYVQGFGFLDKKWRQCYPVLNYNVCLLTIDRHFASGLHRRPTVERCSL